MQARSFFAVVVVALYLPALLSVSVLAQRSSVTDAARKRYEKASKATNIDEVERSMDSSDPMERLKGLRDLTSIEDDHAIDILLQALGDSDMRVRAKAIDSCADLRAGASTPVLIQQLFMTDTKPPVQRRILAALGKIGDPVAARPIMNLLDQKLDMRTRGTAIYALGDLGSADSLALLDDLARGGPNKTIQRLARQAASKVRYAQTLRAHEAQQPLNTFLRPAAPPK